MNMLSPEFSHQAALYDLANKCIVEPLKNFVETIRNFRTNPFCFYWILTFSCSLTTIVAFIYAYDTDKSCINHKGSLLNILFGNLPMLLFHMRFAMNFMSTWRKGNEESDEIGRVLSLSPHFRLAREKIRKARKIRKVITDNYPCVFYIFYALETLHICTTIAFLLTRNYSNICNIDLMKQTSLIIIVASSLQVVLGVLILIRITMCFKNLSKLEAKLDEVAEQEQGISIETGNVPTSSTDTHGVDSIHFPLTLPMSAENH